MKIVRRALLGLVTLLLIADATALALVNFGGGPSDNPSPAEEDNSIYKVVAYIDNAGKAKLIAKDIKKAGVDAEMGKSKRKVRKASGYRLVFKAGSAEIVGAIAETLKHKGYTVNSSEDGTELYLGKNYASKAEAAKMVDRVQRQESIKFEVITGYKMVSQATNKLVARNLNAEQKRAVTDVLVENDIEDFEAVETGKG